MLCQTEMLFIYQLVCLYLCRHRGRLFGLGWGPGTPGWSSLCPCHQTCIKVQNTTKMHKLNLRKSDALRAVWLIPQALFADGFI